MIQLFRKRCTRYSLKSGIDRRKQLIPTVDGGVAPAFEIMTVTPAIRNMIRDNKIPQIDGILYSSAKPDMISMDNSLLALYKSGKISKEIALTYATNPDMLMRKL